MLYAVRSTFILLYSVKFSVTKCCYLIKFQVCVKSQFSFRFIDKKKVSIFYIEITRLDYRNLPMPIYKRTSNIFWELQYIEMFQFERLIDFLWFYFVQFLETFNKYRSIVYKIYQIRCANKTKLKVSNRIKLK